MAESKTKDDKKKAPTKAKATSKKPEKKAAPKKPEAKKATGKKVAEKKPTEKKAAEKKTAEKKPTEKKAAEKKTAEKKPTEKKAAEKKKEAKKPSTKKKAGKKKAGKKRPAFKGPTSDIKVNVYGIDGKSKGKINLPKVFDSEVRLDLIREAVTRSRANRRQPYGPGARSGLHHSVEQWGKGRGAARVMRIKNERRGAQSPGTVGGRRAHPPRPERDWSKKMNAKERRLARMAALSAVKDGEFVTGRGHRFDEKLTLPIVVEEDFERMDEDVDEGYTQAMIEILENLGLMDDVERAYAGRHERAGKGKRRGRRFRTPKSLLIIVEDVERVRRFVRNLPGVEVVSPSQLSVERLAPGGDPGRLTVFSVQALESIMRW
jgi:large subunit ribosomal protein L4e